MAEDNLRDIIKDVNEIILYLDTAKKSFLSNQVLVDRDRLIDDLHRLCDSLPEAIVEGENIIKDRDRILMDAQQQYDNIINDSIAQSREKQLAADKKIKQSTQDVQASLQEAQAVRKDADDYAKQICQNAEIEGKRIIDEAQGYANQMVNESRHEADVVVAQATQQAAVLVSKEQVMLKAKLEAQEITEHAQASADGLFLDAVKQTENILKELDAYYATRTTELHNYMRKVNQYRGNDAFYGD